MARLLGAMILVLEFGGYLMPLIPTPRQVGPYLDPIGGGQYAPLHDDKEHNCTEFDIEYCYDT